MQIKLEETQYFAGNDYNAFREFTKSMVDKVSGKAVDLGVVINWMSAEWETQMNTTTSRRYDDLVVSTEYFPQHILKVVAE